MAIQMQINKTPTPCPGRAGGSSSWRAESTLLGGPAPAPAPRSHMKGNDSVLEVPSFRKKPQVASLHHTIPGPSSCLYPGTQPGGTAVTSGGESSHCLQFVPAQAIFRLFLPFWGLSSQLCSWRIRAALRAPGGIAVGAGQQQGDSTTSSWESPGLFIPGSEINRVERAKRNYVGNGPGWTR